MSRHTFEQILRYLRVPWLTGAILATVCAGVALAASNSIHIKTPKRVKRGAAYSIKLSGHAARTERLYMFVDFFHCTKSPAGEHFKNRANGDYWTVNGNFHEVSGGWHSPLAAPYHVCAYLVKASKPLNPSTGVVAHRFATFHVHR